MSFGSNVVTKGSVFRRFKRAKGEFTNAPEDITRLCLEDDELFAEWVVDNIAIVKRLVDEILAGKPYASYFDRPDSPVTRDDLISAGVVGFYEARKKFDPSRGVKFATYAYNWVRCYIYREIQKAFKGMPPAQRPDQKQEEDEASDSRNGARLLSLDRPVFQDEDSATYMDLIPSQGRSPEEEVTLKVLKEAIDKLVEKCLDEQEREVVTRLWLEGRTPKQLAEEWGVPQKDIIEIRRRAVEKMRDALYKRKSPLSRKTRLLLLSFRP